MTQNQGYSPKDLYFEDKGRKKLANGVAKMAKSVKSTLGPGGNTVLIESPNHITGLQLLRTV